METEVAHSIQMLLKSLKEEVLNCVHPDLGWEPHFRSHFDDLTTFMRVFQIAFAIGDATGADRARYLLRKRMRQKWENTFVKLDVIYLELVEIWSEIGSADEMKGWAAYYVGQLCVDCYQHREYSIYWLELSFKHAKTGLLRFYSSRELSNAYRYRNISDSLKWCDRQKGAALELQNREYLCHALQDACRTSCLAGVFKEARLVTKLLKLMAEATPQLMFYEVLSLSMEGLLAHTLYDLDKSMLASKAVLEKAATIPTSMKDHVERYCRFENNVTSPLVISMVVLSMMEAWDRITWIHQRRGNAMEVASAPEPFELEIDAYTSGNHLSWRSIILRKKIDLCMKQACLKLVSGAVGEIKMDWEKLEEAEAYAAQLLYISAGDAQHTSHALSLLAYISRMYNTSANIHIWIMDNLLVRAANLVPDGPERFVKLKQHADILFESGLYIPAIDLYEKCLATFFKVETSFPSLVDARIAYLEEAKDVFRRMQNSLLSHRKRSQALIWSERERARNLLYGIKKRVRARGFKTEMQAFDHSYKEAWKEIYNICGLVSSDTVFIVYTMFKNHLEPNDTIISYLLHRSIFGEVQVVTHVSNICPTLIRSFTGNKAMEKSDTLFTALWPWEKELQYLSIKKIIIVPTEELSTFPFAALYDVENKKYLIQTYAITMLPSLRLFKQCELRWAEGSFKGNLKRALVVGNPTLNLPGAEREAKYVHNKLNEMGIDTILLNRENATPKKVLDILPATNWIHIASHAVVNNDSPHGALILAPSIADCTSSIRNVHIPMSNATDIDAALENFCRDANFFDGKLTGDLIEKVGQLDAKVTILSACQTGLGKVSAEGLLGLCRSFHVSGVSTVIVSLWKVNDRSTEELMKRFYINISEGMDVVVALQRAMKSMVEEKSPFGNPKYKASSWAPFVAAFPSVKRIFSVVRPSILSCRASGLASTATEKNLKVRAFVSPRRPF